MTTNDPSEAKSDEKIGVIKIKHLALRSCWQMYSEKCTSLGLEIEGKKLNVIFKAWLAVKSMYNNRKKTSSKWHPIMRWSKKKLKKRKIKRTEPLLLKSLKYPWKPSRLINLKHQNKATRKAKPTTPNWRRSSQEPRKMPKWKQGMKRRKKMRTWKEKKIDDLYIDKYKCNCCII